MNKAEAQNSGMIVIPLKEYNYLKSVDSKIGKKLNSKKNFRDILVIDAGFRKDNYKK